LQLSNFSSSDAEEALLAITYLAERLLSEAGWIRAEKDSPVFVPADEPSKKDTWSERRRIDEISQV
jgi:hypothetical protein